MGGEVLGTLTNGDRQLRVRRYTDPVAVEHYTIEIGTQFTRDDGTLGTFWTEFALDQHSASLVMRMLAGRTQRLGWVMGFGACRPGSDL